VQHIMHDGNTNVCEPQDPYARCCQSFCLTRILAFSEEGANSNTNCSMFSLFVVIWCVCIVCGHRSWGQQGSGWRHVHHRASSSAGAQRERHRSLVCSPTLAPSSEWLVWANACRWLIRNIRPHSKLWCWLVAKGGAEETVGFVAQYSV
jgi:hypothetical protein